MRTIAKKGFTLIELLVSIVIISIIGLVVIQAFFTTVRATTKAEILREIKQNGDYAMNTITRKIRNAGTVIVNSASSIDVTDSSNANPETITVNGGRVEITAGGVVEYFTASSVEVTSLQFTEELDSLGDVVRIHIAMTMTQAGTPGNQVDKASMNFSTTVQLRSKSYY